ncbi:hypothetical protein G3M48_008259 [Beauveria asiatica]|uniref:Uncharacterized protein n=1 Tax=Beauveria asiatica TaxID=1069075 RepID=A0AAW0S4P4_9HYPO
MDSAKVAIVYLPVEELDAMHTKEQIGRNGGQAVLIASDLSTAVNCRALQRAGQEGHPHKKDQEGHGLGNSTPMGGLGQPSELATTYVFLASGESQFMSGQTLHPNDGIVVNG